MNGKKGVVLTFLIKSVPLKRVLKLKGVTPTPFHTVCHVNIFFNFASVICNCYLYGHTSFDAKRKNKPARRLLDN